MSHSLNDMHHPLRADETTAALNNVRHLLRADETADAFARLTTLKESVPPGDMWRVHEMFGEAFFTMGDAEGAASAYLNAAKCDRFLTAQMQHFSNYLFALQYLPNIDNEAIFNEHIFYGKLAAMLPTLKPLAPPQKEGGKIRVGYLAADFAPSAAANFFAPFLTDFDRDNFTVFTYALNELPPDLPAKSVAFAEKVCRDTALRVLPPDYAQAAETIRRDNLDILIELGGHSAGGRGLIDAAHRLAPIQICTVGYMGTSGLYDIDYVLADKIMWQTGDEKYFTEQPLILPQAFCFAPSAPITPDPEQPSRPFTFANFGNFMKITDAILTLWRDILSATPRSRLILQDTTTVTERLRQMLRRVKKAGFDPARVEVRPAGENFQHTYNEVDLILNTFPYPGGAMTATALALKTPVVALKGTRYGSRFADELLTAAHCQALLADSPADYAKKAVQFARKELSLPNDAFARPLTDTKNYMRNIEQMFTSIISLP